MVPAVVAGLCLAISASSQSRRERAVRAFPFCGKAALSVATDSTRRGCFGPPTAGYLLDSSHPIRSFAFSNSIAFKSFVNYFHFFWRPFVVIFLWLGHGAFWVALRPKAQPPLFSASTHSPEGKASVRQPMHEPLRSKVETEDTSIGIHTFGDDNSGNGCAPLSNFFDQPRGARSDKHIMTKNTSNTPFSKPSKRKTRSAMKSTVLLAFLAATAPSALAQNSASNQCIPLTGSTACPAFNTSSFSTSPGLISSYPWLAFVSNTQQFDQQINHYIANEYAAQKYRDILGCSGLNLSNTTQLYARYTTSVICNAIVQNSNCTSDIRPLCADTCAHFAISEQTIISNNETCQNPGKDAIPQIRSDFTVCSLPAGALSGGCITGAENENTSCGFQSNLIGLCQYCGSSSPNATDSCCLNSDLSACSGIKLPSITLTPLFPTATVTATATPKHSSGAAAGGISTGAIAGIAIGAAVVAALLIGLIVFFCLRRRNRGSQKANSIFNQPSPQRKVASGMVFNPVHGTGPPQQGYEVLPGGRIARMSALERPASDQHPYAVGAIGDSRRRQNGSSSDGFNDSPDSQARSSRRDALRAPPGRRNGSLSSGSVLAVGDNPSSPLSQSGDEFSSPHGVASQQSEQLPFFKDYYSQDEIHPNDKVATLWAYQPRAGDEFELERGDMLKVVGIWDDGWATGVRLTERAEDWDAKRKAQRDSGVSSGTGRRTSSPPPNGEIKAFPLVCVCLPEHWKKTLDSDSSAEPNSEGKSQPQGSQGAS